MSLNAFQNAPLWQSTKVFAGINFLGYAINVVAPHCHYHVDLLGTGSFAVAAWPGVQSTNQRIRWSSRAVVVWSVKLASFLLYRVVSNGSDARLDANLADPVSAAGFWFISAAWGIVCSLPHALGTTSTGVGSRLCLNGGAALFGLGLATETMADLTKTYFKSQNPGQFCDMGVWSISQHPNWLGNLMLWGGIFLMNAPALIEPAAKSSSKTKAASGVLRTLWRYRRVGLALASPLFMWTLFDAQATGKILGDSLAANHAKYGYGTDPKFTKYIDETPLIIPNPLKWFK